VIEKTLGNLRAMKGARQAVTQLRRAGCHTAIISAGISILAERLRKTLGIDYSLANELVVDENGILTGEGEEVVPLLGKVGVFRKFASAHQTALEKSAVIGDSKFDVPVFEEAGLSIAFNSEDDQVKQKADVVVEGKDLSKVVPFILDAT
jgi:phosphoserine phosphatase